MAPPEAEAPVAAREVAALDGEGTLRSLGCGPAGLSGAEALRRRRRFGPNRIAEAATPPAWRQLLWQFTQLFSLILWVAATLAFAAERTAPGQGMARLGFVIVSVIVVSGVFAFVQERRGEHTLAALSRLLPLRVALLRDGRVAEAAADELVPGDVVLLGHGDAVPADCRVLDALALRANLSALTGEAAAAGRDAAASASTDPLRATNLLLAGTTIVAGQARAVVYATGAHTELGRIAALTQRAAVAPSPLQQELARLSRLIGLFAVGVGAAAFAAGLAVGVPVWQDLVFAIGVIVAMVPEGLLPTLTLSLVLATQRMARRQVLVRHLASVETLGCVSVICSDKTGTLTENRLRPCELLIGRRRLRFDELPPQPAPAAGVDLFTVARLCHELKAVRAHGAGGPIGDPTETALVEMAAQVRPATPAWTRVDALPFDSERMRQSVVFATPHGRVLLCKGAPESVLGRCVAVGDDAQPLDDAARAGIAAGAEAMAGRGLRVLGFAWRRLDGDPARDALEDSMVFLGLVGLDDPPRAQVPEALAQCRSAGIRVVMVTGDHPRTATALAAAVGLVEAGRAEAITGEQLEAMSAAQLHAALGRRGVLFARATAAQKLRIVEALKAQGQIVAVTGDGVNDAPALKAAHIGVAMGIAGADVAKQAADIVLLDDNFASIVAGIEEGRAVFDNIRKFLTYVLTHNVAELVPFLAFALLRVPLPLTPIQALAIDMGTDSLTAVGLGAERADPGVMHRPPRPAGERLLNRSLALRAYLFLGPIEAAAAMAAYFHVLLGGGWRPGQELAADAPLYLQATTACMVAIVAMQLVNAFACRSPTRSVIDTGFGGNRWIGAGLALAVGLTAAIVGTPWGQAIFGTAPPPLGLYAWLVPAALAFLGLEEARKAWVRRGARAQPGAMKA